MTADRARVSYDPTRQYRSVVAQQGRVTLEADTNEAAVIAGEARRLETIDIVGPAAALKNGYLPGSGSGPGGVAVAPGVFYLSGWRLALDAAIDLTQQPDWLDQPPVSITTGNFLVALLLNEQIVCAVEDQALREVALGGPDTAARARLMQHFLRLPLKTGTCADGATLVQQDLAADGVTLDPATLQIMSQARLQVGFVPGPTATDPCTPAAAGGYLGADNQLVRVTVVAYDATAKTGTLLWGWNNASILYRAAMTITGTTPDPFTLTLTGTPVDGEHAPQLGQAVEILRSEADLGDGSFIAAPQGFVTTLAQAYNFDTGEVSLVDQLPPEYQSDKNPLFIRLWQAQVPFSAGQATALDDVSGVTVTVTLPALPSLIALRPFWRFAVRPSTPVLVYPQRYLEAPQPPDGPRQWIADLAVMAAKGRAGSTLVEVCRPIFPPAAAGGQCCTLTLGPDDVAQRGGLQAVLDGLTAVNSGVSLLAGTYPLAAPLKLVAQHSGLILEACGGQVILVAKAADVTPFRPGLIQLAGASDITLRGLTIQMPVVPVSAQPGGSQSSVGISPATRPTSRSRSCTFAGQRRGQGRARRRATDLVVIDTDHRVGGAALHVHGRQLPDRQRRVRHRRMGSLQTASWTSPPRSTAPRSATTPVFDSSAPPHRGVCPSRPRALRQQPRDLVRHRHRFPPTTASAPPARPRDNRWPRPTRRASSSPVPSTSACRRPCCRTAPRASTRSSKSCRRRRPRPSYRTPCAPP